MTVAVAVASPKHNAAVTLIGSTSISKETGSSSKKESVVSQVPSMIVKTIHPALRLSLTQPGISSPFSSRQVRLMQFVPMTVTRPSDPPGHEGEVGLKSKGQISSSNMSMVCFTTLHPESVSMTVTMNVLPAAMAGAKVNSAPSWSGGKGNKSPSLSLTCHSNSKLPDPPVMLSTYTSPDITTGQLAGLTCSRSKSKLATTSKVMEPLVVQLDPVLETTTS